MAHPPPRFLSQRLGSSLRSFSRPSTRSIRAAPPLRYSHLHTTARKSVAGDGGGPRVGREKITFWPFLAIAVIGSGMYALIVNNRVGVDTPPPGVSGGVMSSPTSSGQLLKAPAKDTPAFSPKNVNVLFVLGGPGAGKGTQCANLVRDYGFTHLSAGDLLRAEQDRAGSQFGSLIKDCIKNGTIVPMEVTVQLLENAMAETLRQGATNKGKFLIDGFPRKMDQAVKFEETVCPAKFVLFFDCPEEEMERRLMKRGETSGRADDNAESIKKRFRTFVETSMPVVDYFEKQQRVVRISATKAPEAVYEDVKTQIASKFGKDTLEK